MGDWEGDRVQERRHMTTYRIVDREQNGIPFFDQERNWFIFGDTSASAPGEQRHYEVRAAPRFGIFKETYVTSVTLIRFQSVVCLP